MTIGSSVRGRGGTGSNSYEWISQEYAASRGGSARVQQICRALESLLDPRSSVLDVGAGPGEIARGLAHSGHEVTAVDISIGMCRLARNLGLRTVCANAEALPFENEAVQHVLFVWSLNHIESPFRALREAVRVASTEGSVVVVSGLPSHPQWDALGRLVSQLDTLRPTAVTFQQMLDAEPVWEGWAVQRRNDIVHTFRQRATGLADRVEERSYGHLKYAHFADDIISKVVRELRSLPVADAYRLRQNRHPVYLLRRAGRA